MTLSSPEVAPACQKLDTLVRVANRSSRALTGSSPEQRMFFFQVAVAGEGVPIHSKECALADIRTINARL